MSLVTRSPGRALGVSWDARANGHIELIIGPMYAGKTSELLRRVRRYRHAGRKVLLLKHGSDDRYEKGNVAVTHDRINMDAVAVYDLSEVDTSECDVVGVDEGQFFGPVLAQVVDAWARDGKVVVVAMLDSMFDRRPFDGLGQMVARAEFVDKLSAICKECGTEASFTMRRGSDKSAIVVGGEECYSAVCYACHCQYTA